MVIGALGDIRGGGDMDIAGRVVKEGAGVGTTGEAAFGKLVG